MLLSVSVQKTVVSVDPKFCIKDNSTIELLFTPTEGVGNSVWNGPHSISNYQNN